MIRQRMSLFESRAGPRQVPAALALAALALAVAALWPVPAAAISVITIDGTASPGEWDQAEVVITDPNEADYTNDQYDVKNIYLTGGYALYMRVDTWQTPFTLDGLSRRAFLNFTYSLDPTPTEYYCITINDGFGFPKGELHLVRKTATTWTDLGLGTYAIGNVFEAVVPWSLFPPGVVPPLDTPGGAWIYLDNFTWIFESGNRLADDYEEGSFVRRNVPVPVVPEPLTAIGVLMGCAGMIQRWRHSKRGISP